MLRQAIMILTGFVLTYTALTIATMLGGTLTVGSGSIIGLSLGLSKIYTKDNSMFSWESWCILIACLLGGTYAGYRVE